MSGICGVFQRDGSPVSVPVLQKMALSLGEWQGEQAQVGNQGVVGFAHRRLEMGIPQPEQPFTLDGQVYITADARIDDQERLHDQLLSHG
ncbi:MAG: hypothetical protein F6K03_18430, partial [Kamptonema sp. SIO4C4]|nr:hypothetical protein [Kamptonema sp. SIO4C4]